MTPRPKKAQSLFLTIAGPVSVAMGLVFGVIFGQTTILVCHRIEPDRIDCRLESDFLGIGMREAEIRQLQSAEVQVNSGGRHYRVMLVTNSGNVPLTSYYSSKRSSKQKVVNRINAFIANPSQPSLEFRKKNWGGLIFGCIFVFFGLYILVPKSTLFPGWLLRFLGRRMLPLAELLDDRHFEMKAYSEGTMMSGLYHGRPTRFRFSPGGAEFPQNFQVKLSCRHHFSSKIYKESMLPKVGKALGFVPDVEIGDPELDRQLVFRCDTAQGLTHWMGLPEVKEKVASLVLAERVDSLELDDGFLGVRYLTGRYHVLGIPLGSGLKEKITPWNVTFVLQKLETLAQSLESSM